jgi:DNA-binding NarL/FixJ family response regulator
MQTLTIVVLQSDPTIASRIAGLLNDRFQSVHVASSVRELRNVVPQYRAGAAILDMEASGLSEVEGLHREFPRLAIVCTHRVADEEMWTSALNAGATDMCPTSDTEGIVQSALRNLDQPA